MLQQAAPTPHLQLWPITPRRRAPAQLEALAEWETAEVFSATERAVLRLTDAMTRDIHFEPEILSGVRQHLGERGPVEVAATIAAYNMVSRFLEALQIHSDDPR